ncbi:MULTISPECIES: hypothetical protein [Emticicia]|uniref:hypothetical protein n=1 Tax=Emticicia TaxID=312278 RepID=UPI0007D8A82E|nr:MULTISPECIES: hypothetical protein [Emticicia]
MWVEIESEIFFENQNIAEIRKLLQDLCYKHKYEVYINLLEVQGLSAFKSIYGDIKEVIEAFYNKFTTESCSIDFVVSSKSLSTGKFSLTEAIIFFNLPFTVILENSNNDGYFLDALQREFVKKSKKIKRFKDNHWLVYGNSGGSGNVINFIEEIRRRFSNDNRFLKCFVLLDSDLEYPQNTNTKRIKIEQYLLENNIPYHFLEKREIENYLPDNIIATIDIEDSFIKTYCKRLTHIQKDFIDIENGLNMSIDSLKKQKINVYNLFINENDTQSDIESKLQGLRVGIKAKFDNFKNDFPKLFEHATQEELMERCKEQVNPNELKDILDKISKLL